VPSSSPRDRADHSPVTWYTPYEMGKRIGLYHSCQAIGGMFAGALQTAFNTNLDGRYGIPGWRWTFIMNGWSALVACPDMS
jgi:sugar phosphate permease